MDCLFCKFISGELKTEVIYEDEYVLAFKDINPMAKIHLLFIPKNHSRNIGEMCAQGDSTHKLMEAIATYAYENQLNENGYRVVTNMGQFGGQSIFHTHFHLLAGEQLGSFGC